MPSLHSSKKQKSKSIFFAFHKAQPEARIVSFNSAEDRNLFLDRLPRDIEAKPIMAYEAAILLSKLNSVKPTVAEGAWLSHAHYPGPLGRKMDPPARTRSLHG